MTGPSAMINRALPPAYGPVHKSFHWVIFALIVAQYAVGSVMPHVRPNTRFEGLVAWHVSIGAAILVVLILRFAWRAARPVPLLAMPVWQSRAAVTTHAALYVLIFVMCILGWAASSYLGWTVKLGGILPLPSLAPKGTEWAHTAGDIHDALVYVLLAFILLHVAAALYHQFYLKDRLVERMLPSG
jgi:cytochrome b561